MQEFPDRKTFVSYLECSETGRHYPADQIHNLSDAGKPLLVRYDLNALKTYLTKPMLRNRPADLWRYREFLPVRKTENIVSLGEIMTPVIRSRYLESKLAMDTVAIKDEGRLPTGSFKARGIALAVSMAKELGLTKLAIPTNGNAGAALAAYSSRAGLQSYAFCPEDTPEVNVREIAMQGAATFRVNGLINDCGKIVREGQPHMDWFDISTLKEPYRIEGKKTMGLELCEQYQWQLPDVILYPTGGGTGLIGMWKAFAELEAIGWIGSKRPRMIAVQAEGCAPIVKAFDAGDRHAALWENASTRAAGIRVPVAIGDFLILDAVRQSQGFACSVSDEDIELAQGELASREGLLLCPEGAATVAALIQEINTGRIGKDESVLLFNCATGLKYEMPESQSHLDITHPIDYTSLAHE